MEELGIVEVRVSGENESPVVILREANGRRHLAIWMSAAGAAGILAALEPPDVDHPSSHDLVVDLAETLNRPVTGVTIVGHQDGIFYTEISVGTDVLVARPSDALAIAVRAGVPIWCADGVLAAVGIVLSSNGDAPEAEVEAFREFLDSVNPDDFDSTQP